MAIDGLEVCAFVWSRLVADSGPGGVNALLGGTPTTPGRIYRDRVPQAAALPAVTVGLVAAPDTITLGGVRVMTTVDVDVRVVGAGAGYGALVPIAKRVDVVLDQAGGAAGAAYAYKLSRADLRAFVEDDAGAAYTHVIATYRTESHAAP